MSYDITDEDLNNMFKDIRNCVDVRVAVDRRTAQPRGFAHCDFVDIESAAKAKESLNGLRIKGRAIRCDFSSHLPGKGIKSLAMDPTRTDFEHEPRLRKVHSFSGKETPSTETRSNETTPDQTPSTTQ